MGCPRTIRTGIMVLCLSALAPLPRTTSSRPLTDYLAAEITVMNERRIPSVMPQMMSCPRT